MYNGSHGVIVSTLDFESSDPSSSLGGTLSLYFSSYNKGFFFICTSNIYFAQDVLIIARAERFVHAVLKRSAENY